MKKIFEEYGFIILTCVVVIALIGITIGVKPLMASSISNITNSWGSEAKESLNDAWNEDGFISKKESYIGKYADIDGNGTVDGVIFADLAFSKSGEWGNTYGFGTYSYSANSDLKQYYVSQKSYTDDFGTAEVIAPVSETSGNDRFYVMALDDVGKYYDWYYSARYSISNIDNNNKKLTSIDFGTGKTNTTTMILKWNSSKYGEQNGDLSYDDQSGERGDIWGAIKTQANNGWFVPSRAEWAAFASAFSITRSNSESYGLYYSYWSSSLSSKGKAYFASFYFGVYINDCKVDGYDGVRLAKTF